VSLSRRLNAVNPAKNSSMTSRAAAGLLAFICWHAAWN
jgi:hypothetical protein